jgi:hypothetical protein
MDRKAQAVRRSGSGRRVGIDMGVDMQVGTNEYRPGSGVFGSDARQSIEWLL